MNAKQLTLALTAAAISISACSPTPQPTPPNDTAHNDQTTTVPITTPSTAPVMDDGADKPPPVTEEPPPRPEDSDRPNSGGRLAFTTCSEESRKVSVCAQEFKPVCAEADTGIRCIRAPCPSTAKRDESNACTACKDPKVAGYWPGKCDAMQSPAGQVQ